MMSRQTAAAMTLVLALAGVSGPRAASAQIGSASPNALATANNYTTLARGFTAIGLNPAGLAMPGNPGFSLSLLPVHAQAGLSGMKLSEVATYDEQIIPNSVRQEWLNSVTEDGGFELRSGASATVLALSVGPVGLQISTVGAARANLSPDAFELMMFGNAGLTGTPRTMSLEGTEANSWAATTGALAVGIPLPSVQDGKFAMGATLKYTVGHLVALASDAGSVVQGDSIGLSLPSIINIPDDFSANPLSEMNKNGTGVGLDLGLAWEGTKWAFSAAVHNVFNTFQWELNSPEFRVGELTFDIDSIATNFDPVAVPQGTVLALQSELLAQRFEPAINLGVAYRPSEKLAFSSDYRHETGEALVLGERSSIGLGVEWHVIPFLPLRAGASAVSGGGVQLGAGFGLEFGAVQLSAAYLSEKNSAGEFRAASFALSFGG